MASVAIGLRAGQFGVRIPVGARDLFFFPKTVCLAFSVRQVRFRGVKSLGC